jgi:hypothetical protein
LSVGTEVFATGLSMNSAMVARECGGVAQARMRAVRNNGEGIIDDSLLVK